MKYLIFFFVFFVVACGGGANTEKTPGRKLSVLDTAKGNIIFYNVENRNYDRLMFCGGRYFIWIYEPHRIEEDHIAMCGKYNQRNDSIFFTIPDSTDESNCIYSYRTNDYYKTKDLEIGPTDPVSQLSDILPIYNSMFRGDGDTYELGFGYTTISGSFEATWHHDTLVMDYENQKFVQLK